jgi:hypothetical protein
MRRALRILLNGVTVLSALLCVAVVVLWVRSYWTRTTVGWSSRSTASAVVHRARCFGGVVEYRRGLYRCDPGLFVPDPIKQGPVELEEWTLPSLQSARSLGYPSALPGVTFDRTVDWHDYGLVGGLTASLALWMPAALFAALPSAAGLRAVRRRRAGARERSRSCATCGYDLRATPDRCPECGTVVKV